MNRFITNISGGYPRVVDIHAFIQDSLGDAFKGILSAYGISPSESFIISGVSPEDIGTAWQWGSGYISINGEVCKVDAGTFTKPATQSGYVFMWYVHETYDPAGNFQFFDQSTHDTFQLRKGKIGYFPTPSGGYSPPVLPTLFELTKTKLASLDSGYQAVVYNNNWSNGSVSLGVKKSYTGHIIIKGDINNLVNATNGLLFTLPVNYRPSSNFRQVVPTLGGAASTIGIIEVKTDGTVSLLSEYCTHVYIGFLTYI